MSTDPTHADANGIGSAHALLIGVANYDNIGSLPEAILRDVKDLAEVLTSPSFCGYDRSNVTVLLNEQADAASIRAALQELASRAGPDDAVLIFFSGHGDRFSEAAGDVCALLPRDFDEANLSGTGLLETELSGALQRIKARKLLILLDACHSGGTVSLKNRGSLVGAGFSSKSLQGLVDGTGRVVVASSRETEASLVLHGARNSLFTTHLLDGLRGNATRKGDGLIRVFELFNYVSEQVRRSMPGQQHPVLHAARVEDDFPVAFARGGAKGAGLLLPEDRSPPRDLDILLADLYPTGPQEEGIWMRAGGDLSRLRLQGSGRAQWFSALRTLRQGGGGAGLRVEDLVRAALDDFPQHAELSPILAG
jgi:hypothetical protein